MFLFFFADSNRFGTKMLEKMGWSKGKGLGLNLEGGQDFIKVAHKADQRGIGFEDRDDQWTQHEDEFNSLLKSLDNGSKSASEDDEEEDTLVCTGFGFASSNEKKTKKSSKVVLSGKSLEEQSKMSKARVHYKKFTKGKDLTKYSEKDLANIFGKKTFEPAPIQDFVESNDSEEERDTVVNSFGITTIETGTSIADYFKNKKTPKVNETAYDNTSKSFEQDDSSEPIVKKKKKKKNTADETSAPSAPVEAVDVSNVVEVDEEIEEVVSESKASKKDKKKKKKKADRENEEKSNSSTDIQPDESSTAKKRKNTVSEEPSEEQAEDDASVKSKKRKSAKGTDPQQNVNIVNHILTALISNKKKIMGAFSTETAEENALNTEATSSQPPFMPHFASFGENIYEINRYQAEVFRFLDLDGFKNSNLCDLAGYGYSKNFEVKVTAKTQDQNKISDLWDHALVSKYGRDAVKAKKKQKYSIKTLKKKNLFKGI